jgi:hypothetical protein
VGIIYYRVENNNCLDTCKHTGIQIGSGACQCCAHSIGYGIEERWVNCCLEEGQDIQDINVDDYKILRAFSFKNLMDREICHEGLKWHKFYNPDFANTIDESKNVLKKMIAYYDKNVMMKAIRFWIANGFIERVVHKIEVGNVYESAGDKHIRVVKEVYEKTFQTFELSPRFGYIGGDWKIQDVPSMFSWRLLGNIYGLLNG